MEGGDAEVERGFVVERAKTGRASCKKCKTQIESGQVRLAKLAPNPFGSGTMKQWYHPSCLFQVFSKQRATTAKIESVDDIGGWADLDSEGKDVILPLLPEEGRVSSKVSPDPGSCDAASESKPLDPEHKDNSLRELRKLCAKLADTPSYLDKTKLVSDFITFGASGGKFQGDLELTVRLLLPGVIKRVYNLQSKQIVKLFSRLFNADLDDMTSSMEEGGDVAETVRVFFESSDRVKPAVKSTLSLTDVDRFLDRLTALTREEDQTSHFQTLLPRCTGNDLKLIIRLIKHDLRINAGAKHVLDAVHPEAYQAFQSSRDLRSVLSRVGRSSTSDTCQTSSSTAPVNRGISLLTPVLPMLAAPCKSAEEALKKCPNGMFADIKYDGERVQVHKQAKVFRFYSRSLKPVVPHKVASLKEYIPKAFPHGRDLVLDCEILLMDTATSKPLPFGTLGVHKKNEFKDATVCLFVFDCIFFNGDSLVDRPVKERREILESNMTEIPHRVVFSEMTVIRRKEELEALMVRIFREGLEGLVLKDLMSSYEPGKRHWLKVKKDYLFGGSMADTADLVVLGAWYGTGQKGGMMSVFLMGCYDERRGVWCTVTKVHTGHDDATLASLQKELKMVKIGRDAAKVPSWLKCTSTMVPDFVAQDPKKQPVWEITGAELTKHIVHTADGISVRFPRVTRIRTDKDWATATSLAQLKELYVKSKETSDFVLPGFSGDLDQISGVSPTKKPKMEVDTGDEKPRSYKLRNPLPDVFRGVRLAGLDDEVGSAVSSDANVSLSQLARYFIAFGGEVVEGADLDLQATHRLLSPTQRKGERGVVGVTVKSLLKCICTQTPLEASC